MTSAMNQQGMKLKILLPASVFLEEQEVTRMLVETSGGSLGIWPRRLDCVAVLVPGILCYEIRSKGEVFVATREGVLVKTGSSVTVSVRQAVGGASLGRLRETIEKEFMMLDEQERQIRSVLAKLESGFIRRFTTYYQH